MCHISIPVSRQPVGSRQGKGTSCEVQVEKGSPDPGLTRSLQSS